MSKKASFKNLENYSKCKFFARFSAIPIPNSRHIHLFSTSLNWMEFWWFFFFKTFDRWRRWAKFWLALLSRHALVFVLKVLKKKNAFTFFSHNEMLLSKKGKTVHYLLYFQANKILMISVTRQLTYSICHCFLFCQFLKCLIWSSLPFVKLNQY